MNTNPHALGGRSVQRGLTLIELMVSLVIGSLLVIATFTVMATFEGRRRTLDSGADLDNSGNVAMYQIDQWVRSAGSGLAQGYNLTGAGTGPYAYGCPLYAATTSGGQMLPATSALPAPFGSVNPGTTGVFRLAPAIILPGQTAPGVSVAGLASAKSDVLVLMSSGTNLGQVPAVFSAAATSSQLTLVNTLAFYPLDLVLLLDQQGTSGGLLAPCMVTQASASLTASTSTNPVTALPLGGASASWYVPTIGSVSISNYSSTGVAMDLGNPSPGTTATTSPPSFQVVGVGDNNTLYSYDLLGVTGTAGQVQSVAQNVFELHALYGVQEAASTTSGCIVDTWVNPSTDTTYTVAALSAGTPAAASLIKTICALRVGLILRTSLPEKVAVKETPTLTLFANFPPNSPNAALPYTRPLAASEQVYRYRTIEATIPVRNNNF